MSTNLRNLELYRTIRFIMYKNNLKIKILDVQKQVINPHGSEIVIESNIKEGTKITIQR